MVHVLTFHILVLSDPRCTQESIFGPLLFLFYINDFFNFPILSFADNAKCFKLIYKYQDTHSSFSKTWNSYISQLVQRLAYNFNTNNISSSILVSTPKFPHLTLLMASQSHPVAHTKTLILSFLQIFRGRKLSQYTIAKAYHTLELLRHTFNTVNIKPGNLSTYH